MSDAFARPTSSSVFAPFDIEAEYLWVDCDLPRYEGLKVEVRLNLKNKERKRLKIALDDINAERERISTWSTTRGAQLDERRAKAVESGDVKAAEKATEERVKLLEETAEKYEQNVQRIHALVAPYVRNWNVMDRDEHGDPIDAPPPMVAGVEAFEVLPDKLIGWVVSSVLGAYRGGKEWPTSLPSASGSAQQPSEPNTETSNDEPEENP